MATTYYNLRFASTYGSGKYDSATYNGTTTTSTSGGTGSSGTLPNTGVAVVGIVTVAATLLLIALVVRVWRRPAKKAKPTDDSSGSTQ